MSKVRLAAVNYRSWMVWGLMVGFYAVQYILRVSNGVMGASIMDELGFSLEQVAFISSLQYLFYSIFQVPVGIAFDRLGPRKPILFCIGSCIVGTFLLAISQNYQAVLMARSLIGFGSIVGFIGSMAVATLLFPARYLPFLTGTTITVGSLGAILGGSPLAFLMQTYDWRYLMISFNCVALMIWLGLFLFLPNNKPKASKNNVLDGVRYFFANKQLILLFYSGVGIYAILSMFADYWAPFYMRNIYGVDNKYASLTVTVIYLGALLGAQLIAKLCYSFSRVLLLRLSLLTKLLVATAVFYWGFTIEIANLGFFVLGLLAGAQFLVFVIMEEFVPKEFISVNKAILNMGMMLLGGLMQSVIGYTIGSNFDNNTILLGMGFIPLWILLSLVSSMFIKISEDK